MTSSPLPSPALDALAEQLRRDLKPVRPARLERRLAPLLLVLAAASMVLLAMTFGLRPDLARLGGMASWGFSLLELVAALGLLVLVLREAEPGNRPSLASLAAAAAGVGGVCLVAMALAFLRSPLAVPAGYELQVAVECMAFELALGLPAMVLLLLVAAGGLTTGGWRLGLLGGLGAGFCGDAVWRLVCPFSSPRHVLAAHLPGILGVALVGVAVALVWQVWRRRRWERSRQH